MGLRVTQVNFSGFPDFSLEWGLTDSPTWGFLPPRPHQHLVLCSFLIFASPVGARATVFNVLSFDNRYFGDLVVCLSVLLCSFYELLLSPQGFFFVLCVCVLRSYLYTSGHLRVTQSGTLWISRILHWTDILNFKVDKLFCYEVCCFVIYLKLVKIFCFLLLAHWLFLSQWGQWVRLGPAGTPWCSALAGRGSHWVMPGCTGW